MASTATVVVDVNEAAIADLARGPEMYDLLRGTADEVSEEMRRGAPVRTGAGRASIRSRVEMTADGWVATASWDERHYYMGIQNSRREFAETALSRVRYV